jgi:hypothetical protein
MGCIDEAEIRCETSRQYPLARCQQSGSTRLGDACLR